MGRGRGKKEECWIMSLLSLIFSIHTNFVPNHLQLLPIFCLFLGICKSHILNSWLANLYFNRSFNLPTYILSLNFFWTFSSTYRFIFMSIDHCPPTICHRHLFTLCFIGARTLTHMFFYHFLTFSLTGFCRCVNNSIYLWTIEHQTVSTMWKNSVAHSDADSIELPLTEITVLDLTLEIHPLSSYKEDKIFWNIFLNKCPGSRWNDDRG